MRRVAVAVVVLGCAMPLAQGGDGPKVVDALAGLRSPSHRRRIEAAWCLAELRTAEVEAAWTDALRDVARPDLRFEAAARLGAFEKLGDDARAALEAASHDDDRAVRLAAAVALRRTADPEEPIDAVDTHPVGESILGVGPAWAPIADAPKTLDAGALDATVWTECSPINILGEGSVCFVMLRRLCDDLIARVAFVSRRLTRGDSAGGKPGDRRWTTRYELSTGWIDPVARCWTSGVAGGRSRVGRDVGDGSADVGLVLGRLEVPALLRQKSGEWTARLQNGTWTLRFDGNPGVGPEGTVAVSFAASKGTGFKGSVGWHTSVDATGPVVRLGKTITVGGTTWSVDPHTLLFDADSGAASILDHSWDASRTFAYAGRIATSSK